MFGEVWINFIFLDIDVVPLTTPPELLIVPDLGRSRNQNIHVFRKTVKSTGPLPHGKTTYFSTDFYGSSTGFLWGFYGYGFFMGLPRPKTWFLDI